MADSANTPDDEFTIVDCPDEDRYELREGDTAIGFAQYRIVERSIVFTHTVVDGGYEGMGLGSRLAKFVLDDAVAQNRRIVPVCPFISSYLKRHHEYDASVDWPESR